MLAAENSSYVTAILVRGLSAIRERISVSIQERPRARQLLLAWAGGGIDTVSSYPDWDSSLPTLPSHALKGLVYREVKYLL